MPSFDLDSFLPYRLSVASGKVNARFSAHYSDRFGVNVPEWRVLAYLSQNGDVSVREIHQRVNMDKPKISRAVERLELRGLVEKRNNEQDRRLVSLSLTRRGRDKVEKIIPLAHEFEESVVRQLSPKDLKTLERAIDVLISMGNKAGVQ